MISTPATVVASLAVAVLVIAGCDRTGSRVDGPASPGTEFASADQPAESKSALGARGASPGKPLPPIEVAYSIVGPAVVGQPVEIELRTSVPGYLVALNLALSGSERLHVPVEVARLRFAFGAANERHVETIRVTPLTPGRHYLSVLAQAQIDGRVQARSVTIPIDVGGGGAVEPRPAQTSVDADGERIISLPARTD